MPVKFKYKIGQSVYCKFPQEDNLNVLQDRPGLILTAFEKRGMAVYKIAKMTKTDNSSKFLGYHILKNSKEGNRMNLNFDTFIHLGRIEEIPEVFIRRLQGYCIIIDEIRKKCEQNNINI